MTLYLFMSKAHGVRAFTSDATGANLPADYAPWARSDHRSAMPVGDGDTFVAKAVRRHGYFLMSGSVPRRPRDRKH
jgi:hypothetical protein